MKYKELTHEVLEEVTNEVKAYYKKSVVDMLIRRQGSFGVIFEAINSMFYHGKGDFPVTYKYRRELARWLKEYIQTESKRWVSTK